MNVTADTQEAIRHIDAIHDLRRQVRSVLEAHGMARELLEEQCLTSEQVSTLVDIARTNFMDVPEVALRNAVEWVHDQCQCVGE